MPDRSDQRLPRGVALRRAREDAGLEQEEAAEILGVSRVTLSRRENGRAPVTDDEVQRMVRMYQKAGHVRVTEELPVYDAPSQDTGGGQDGGGGWEPSPVLRRNVPPRAYDVALSYLRRLERAGITSEQLDEFERLLLDTRYAQAFSRRGRKFEVDDYILLIESAWRAIQDTLAIYGVHP